MKTFQGSLPFKILIFLILILIQNDVFGQRKKVGKVMITPADFNRSLKNAGYGDILISFGKYYYPYSRRETHGKCYKNSLWIKDKESQPLKVIWCGDELINGK